MGAATPDTALLADKAYLPAYFICKRLLEMGGVEPPSSNSFILTVYTYIPFPVSSSALYGHMPSDQVRFNLDPFTL